MRAAVFWGDQSGAITVDWTVLAAAVVGLGVASVGAVRSGVGSLGSDVETSLNSASVVSLGELGGSGAQAYALRLIDQASLDSILSHLRTLDNATLLANHAGAVAELVEYTEVFTNQQEDAAFNLDALHAYSTVLAERGLSWPGESFESLEARYAAVYE